MADAQFVTQRGESLVATHKVLKNTYMLLSMTLLFSAAMAGVSMALKIPYMGFIPLLVAFGLIFAISKFRNSMIGIFLVFAFTGILGFSLGPILNMYMAGSPQVVAISLSLTGLIFFSLSGYTLMTRKDFSYMSGFLFTGLIVIVGCVIAMWVASFMGYYLSGVHLAISAAIVILMSGFILFDTSRILHGGETNYVMATVSLYLSIYNIFVSLLHIVGAFSDD